MKSDNKLDRKYKIILNLIVLIAVCGALLGDVHDFFKYDVKFKNSYIAENIVSNVNHGHPKKTKKIYKNVISLAFLLYFHLYLKELIK